MRSPLSRIRTGAVIFGTICVAAVVGYRVLGDHDWLDAVWMVVITISSVGFGEQSQSSDSLQVLTIAVILLGMTAAGYTIGGFIQLVLEGELETVLGHRRMTRDIERLSGHVIICGAGRTGGVLAEGLHRKKRPFVVIDVEVDRIEVRKAQGHLCVLGDATEERTLLDAGVERAAILFTALPTDADNVFITLTASDLNKNLEVIARAEHPSTEKKLLQAGASKVIMPTLIGAQHVERMITRPTTADLIELVSQSSFPDLELDEVRVSEDNHLVGVTVRETGASRRHRVLVVAVKAPDGTMSFNPDADYAFEDGDVVMLMGHHEDIQRFCHEYSI